jgi:protein-S-isoprenylcysteine O-methyltransferase
MMTGWPQSISTLLLICIFYALDTLYIHRFDRQRKAEGSGRSISYTLLVWSMVSVLVVQPLLLPWLSLTLPALPGILIQAAGLVFIACAFFLHIWARKHLRQFYAERVEVQPDHQLIDSGPYATIRHPVITSFFLFAGGLFLINPSLPTLLVFGFTLWDFSRAARQEEILLSSTLPGYRQYMTTTGAFFPRLFHNTGE